MTRTLSAQAMTVIHNYLHLTLSSGSVSCPYYNNRRTHKRGGLAVYVGKGTPQDIIDEALAIALQEHVDLVAMDERDKKKFLVDHHLGVDCSGLAYHILDAELQAERHLRMHSVLQFRKSLNPLRSMLRRLRPSENANVQTFAADDNSAVVPLADVRPGDMIILCKSGRNHDRDHMMIIHAVTSDDNHLRIDYTHSLDWRTDGEYDHGVRQGSILVTNPNKPLVTATWRERDIEGEANETLERAIYAESVSIRRLNALE